MLDLLVRREAARYLGNLSANAKYAKEILKRGAVEKLVPMPRSDDTGANEQAANGSSKYCNNVRNQQRMLRMGILEPVEALAKIGLDPKAKRDGETERYCLLLMANIAVSSEKPPRVDKVEFRYINRVQQEQ